VPIRPRYSILLGLEKRPGLLFSVTCAFAGSVWAGAAQSYESFLGARVPQGMSMSYFESVMYAVIGDLYFVHERGTRMALYITTLSGISNIPTMAAGKVNESLGWRWVFWLLAIFSGTLWLLVIFFGWETAFNRKAVYNVDVASQDVS
jgi:MFS family permease